MTSPWLRQFRPAFSRLACFCLALLAVSCTTVQPPPPAEVEPLPPAPYTKGTVAYEMRFHTDAVSVPGGGTKAGRSMTLHATAHPGPAGGAVPQAYHVLPPDMNMGAYLPLNPPVPAKNAASGGKKGWPVVRLYWGCGEKPRPAQPRLVHTVDTPTRGFLPMTRSALSGMAATGTMRPGWVQAAWPAGNDARPVPLDASLVGQHFVHGNFLPHIRFVMDRGHDFMDALTLTAESRDLNAPLPISWNSVPGALGYHVMALGFDQARKQAVLWTSSENPDVNVSGQFLEPRLVKRHTLSMLVLSPDNTRCVIPQGVFAGCETVLVTVTAWGDEYLTGQPLPPAVLKNWDPDWVVKGRFLSTASLVLGSPDGEKTLRSLF